MLHDLPTFICNLSAMFDNTLHRSRSLRNFFISPWRLILFDVIMFVTAYFLCL